MQKIRYYGSKLKSRIINLIFNYERILRKYRVGYFKKYLKLKEYENKYLGRRCFIIGTGPSLSISDLKSLKGEITFGVNAICKIFYELGWETTFYGIQDYRAFKKLKKEIMDIKLSKIIISDFILKKDKTMNETIVFPLNFLNHNTYHNNYSSKFSKDSFEVVYDGYSIVYSMIQIAIYMGFEEIYLLGVDCNYDLKDYYSINHNIEQENPKLAGYKMIEALKIIKNSIQNSEIKIYNASLGGKLDIFPRVKLEDILKNDK